MSTEPEPNPASLSPPAGPIRVTSTAVLSAVFLVIFTSAAVVAELNYPPEAASMPLIIGGIGAALSLLQLIVSLRESRAAVYEEQIELRKDLPIYLWVWAFVGAVVTFGFVIAAPVMLFAYLRWRSREPWWLCLLLSAAVLAILYGLFETVLGVPLFEGLVTPLVEEWLTAAGWLKG